MVNYCVLGLLHSAVVSDVADVSEVHAASVFRIDPKDGGSIYLRKVGSFSHNHTVSQPKNRINITT